MQLTDLLSGGKNHVEIIPVDKPCAEINANYFQPNEMSAFGMLITQSGGIIAENVVRLLGSNRNPEYRDINMFNIKFGGKGYIIIGDDIFGGIFVINTGAMPDVIGNILYFAPDTLEFEDLEITLSDFLDFLNDGDLRGFYAQISDKLYDKCRWSDVKFNQTLSFYPPQYSAEFDNGEPSVSAISVNEYYKLNFVK